jgi:hypothetical protein
MSMRDKLLSILCGLVVAAIFWLSRPDLCRCGVACACADQEAAQEE